MDSQQQKLKRAESKNAGPAPTAAEATRQMLMKKVCHTRDLMGLVYEKDYIAADSSCSFLIQKL